MVSYQSTGFGDKMGKSGRPASPLPKYLLHKPSGLARAVFRGESVYLGQYGTPESHAAFAKVIATFSATGRMKINPNEWTIAEACDAYLTWHASEYPEDSTETQNIRSGTKDLKKIYGALRVEAFAPMDLVALRKGWIERGLSRTTVVKYHFFCLRIFRHAMAVGQCPSEVFHRLEAVPTIRKAQGKAREPEKIQPVERNAVDAALPFLSRQIRAMVEVQWLTGMRPSEVCSMTWSQIERSGDVWWYRPVHHKKKSRGKLREIGIGPKAQAILSEFAEREPHRAIFSAADAQRERAAELRSKRKTKVQPSQQTRAKGKTPADFYLPNGYRQAIERACDKAGIPHWAPNRIRHTMGTEIRKRYGLDHAQAVLGHDHAKITEVYAEIDRSKIVEVIKELG